MECRSVLHCIAPIRNRHAALRPHRCSQRSVASAEPRAAHRSWCSRCCRMEKPGNLQSVVRRLARASLSRKSCANVGETPADRRAPPSNVATPAMRRPRARVRLAQIDCTTHLQLVAMTNLPVNGLRCKFDAAPAPRMAPSSSIEIVGGGRHARGAALTARPVEFRNPSNQHDRARRPSMRGSCFAAWPASR